MEKPVKKSKFLVIILSLLAGLLIPISLFSACNRLEDPSSSTPTKSPDFYIYIGDYIDPIKSDKLLMDYKNETGISVGLKKYTLNNNVSIRKALDGDKPASLYLAGTDATDYYNEASGTSIGLAGYGLVVNKSVIKAIKGFQSDYDVDQYISNLSNMSAEDFNNEVAQIDVVAKSETKPLGLSSLNGVFAFSGSSKDSYGTALLDAIMLSLFGNMPDGEIVDKLFINTDSAMQTSLSNAYVDSLAYYTSMLAGKHATGIRGSDYTSDGLYGLNSVCDMLYSGKAAFGWVDSQKLLEYSNINSCNPSNLSIIPIKTIAPEAHEDKLMASSACRLYANEKLVKEGGQAEQFLTWFKENHKKYNSSLENETLKYLEEGRVIFAPKETSDLLAYKDTVFSKDGVKKYLNLTTWNEETLITFKQFMLDSYGNKKTS